ncbi:serine/threonine-protein phosphatase 6 regulatory ankyrin repeat subunit A-like [Stylophora pistillata]|uniref:serine/threonine-protein phosphatase 6 regulatory ankyrin repeat subunit A-like n=1 Tax=Stylophora pistillata TaxID=50429 RepID=UPI000C03D38C|nr:serine/threonine-protein phosphatase 6 regulatory ankyrin repeat subunit A-like [Stylophora pistillata]
MCRSTGKRVIPLKSLAFSYLSTPDKDSGLSCLQSACIRENVDTVSAILNYSIDKLDSVIAFSIKIGWNASRFAGKSIYTVLRQRDSKDHRQISEFVEKVIKHFQGQSLLHLAEKRGQVEHVRRLLDCGEDVNFRMPDYLALRETPLMLAASFNEVDVVEFLVERGASLELEDNRGFTALHHAAMGGKSENILRLIQLGCNVSKVDHKESSGMHLAAKNGHTEAVRLLLEHGANVKIANCIFMIPFTLAVKNGHLKTIKLLLKNGCDFIVVNDEAGRLPFAML